MIKILGKLLSVLQLPPGGVSSFSPPSSSKKPGILKRIGSFVGGKVKAVPGSTFGAVKKGYSRSAKERESYEAELGQQRAVTGKFFTPNQAWLLKIVFWFIGCPIFMSVFFDVGYWGVFIIWIIGLLYFVLGRNVALVLVIFYIVWYVILTSPLAGTIKAETGPYYDQAKLAVVTQYSKLMSQITGVGEWRNTYATEVKEKKGIEIEKVIGTKETFVSDKDDIEVMGYGIVKPLEEAITVKFGCSMGGIIGTPEKEDLSIIKGVDTSFGIRCNLKKAPSIKEEVEYKNAKFSAIYPDFKTDATLRLYTLSKDEKEKLQGIDIFEKYQIRDSLLDLKYKTTTSTYGYGPLKVSLYVADRQPLVEEETYTLRIGVDNDKLNWGGDLVKLPPPDENKINLLTLEFPPDHITPIGDKCSPFYSLALEESQTFYCDFKINKPTKNNGGSKSSEEGLKFFEIKAKVIYDYEFSKEAKITIVKKEA